MTFEFEKEDPKKFVEDKMKTLFKLIEDTKLEMTDYTLDETDELREHAMLHTTVYSRAMAVFASMIVEQCDYQKAMLRGIAAIKEAEKND